jgi:hypothetical protein
LAWWLLIPNASFRFWSQGEASSWGQGGDKGASIRSSGGMCLKMTNRKNDQAERPDLTMITRHSKNWLRTALAGLALLGSAAATPLWANTPNHYVGNARASAVSVAPGANVSLAASPAAPLSKTEQNDPARANVGGEKI